ncbi:helix-turn-helix transcriptional regulator [Paenibacillus rhizophilus]|nr:AraC family transcriptional regulator [Paenibacillus rhizophilus]
MKLRDSQLQVLWTARVDYSRNSGIKEHSHDFYQLLHIIDGKGSVSQEGRLYPVLSNHCYLFKKGVSHSFHFTEETITFDIKFSLAEEFAKYIANYDWSGGLAFNNIAQFKELFRLSSINLKETHDLLPFRIDVGYKGVLLEIVQDRNSQNSNPQITTPVTETDEGYPMVQYLKQNLSSKINLEEMAEYFNFNSHYLIELFKKNLGTTPMQYLQALRLEKAKEYLEFTSYSVSEIAELIGLTPQYFSRLCMERLGMSPSKIREQMRTVVGKDIILEEDFSIDEQPTLTNIEGS